jgi:hypothetical protein
MSHAIANNSTSLTRSTMADRPWQQAYIIMYAGYVALPLIAGLDKFFERLTQWEKYLSPFVSERLPVSPHTFMQIVGGIEIAAALLVAVRPRIGAYVVALWLFGIIVNLLLGTGYFDIALRDSGLALGALALGRLSATVSGSP